MQEIIRDGALRLMTSEATCDVILNCQGRRLMAHKVMLSIASPLLQELLLADQSETSVLVLPDITSNIMAYMLDYIYTGSVMLHSSILTEFLSAANLLKLKIEQNMINPSIEIHHKSSKPNEMPQNYSNKFYNNNSNYSTSFETSAIYNKNLLNCEYKSSVNACGPECYTLNTPVYPSSPSVKSSLDSKLCDFKLTEKRLKFTPIILQDERNPNLLNGSRFHEDKLKLNTENEPLKSSEINQICDQNDSTIINNINSNNSVQKKKTVRKVPNLMPISKSQFSAFKARKGLYNRVFPSPWCPRIIPVTGDPRNDCLRPQIPHTVPNGPYYCTDISKENIEISDEYNDKNNNLKRSQNIPLNVINNVPATEKQATLYGTLDISSSNNNTALNLNFTNNNSLEQPIDNSLKHFEVKQSNNNNQLQITERRNANVVVTNELTENASVIVNNLSDFQNVGYQNPRISDSTYSSAESSNSSCDVKSVEECVKISDDDNGKEDGDTLDRKQKRYECEDCGKQFSQLRNYKYHRSVHEGTKEFAARCPECGKVFNDRGYLSSHLKIHRDRKEYGCPHCPKRFNQRVAYNMHLRIHTGVKPHVCPTCGKGFSRKMLLKQHQRVHTGERPYQCPECGKSFADRSNMSLHARLHTGVKPYACNLCPKSFTKKHHLKTHMNYHTGLKPYVCQKCGLTFSQSSNMRTHYKKCIQKDSTDVTSTATINNIN